MLRLVQINGTAAGRIYHLNDFQTVGRSPANHLVLDDPSVSRDQCAIHVQNGLVTVVARDQTSPVLLNGYRVENCSVRPGDVVQFGQTQFQVQAPLQPTIMPLAQAPPPMGNSGNFNQITVVQQQGASSLWSILAIALAIPLIAMGFMIVALLPYLLIFAGLFLIGWGALERRHWHGYGYSAPMATYAKAAGGVGLIFFAALWLFTKTTT